MADVFVESWELEFDHWAPRTARKLLRERLDRHIDEELLDTVLLLASEVVTNAVVHARSRALVTLALRPRSVLVSVGDLSSNLPAPVPALPEWEHGRGLDMVQSLAAVWGVHGHGTGGKTVWFQLDRADATADSDDAAGAGTVHV